MELTNTVYNMPEIISLPKSTELNREKLENAFKKLIDRHDRYKGSTTRWNLKLNTMTQGAKRKAQSEKRNAMRHALCASQVL
jgi:hypothetical protein